MATGRLRLLFIIPLALCAPWVCASDEQRLRRDFSEPLNAITIINPDGNTEVQTWQTPDVRLVASAQRTSAGLSLDSFISFERPGPQYLRIRVKPIEPGGAPVNLTLHVPAAKHVAVRSVGGSITIAGRFAGLSVDTEYGPIVLNLSEDQDLDLSLRALEGSIENKMPLKVFGRADVHTLDGRLGNGGSAVIARSSRGSISIRPDAAGRSSANADNKHQAGSEMSSAASGFAAQRDPSGSADDIRAVEDAIKLEARLVNLNVKVSDAGGKTLPSLSREDFVVYEDEVEQIISHFEPITAPLHIVLLLDLSGSTEHKMKVMKKAAQRFIDSLNLTDNIAVAGFTRRFFVISNFTANRKLLKDRVGDIKNRHSGTAYYDAMWATLDLLEEANAARKAIVVLTDGVDNSLDHPDDPDFDPKHDFDELFSRIEEADITIYPVYLDTEYETIGRSGRSGHDAYVTARKQLEAVAAQTGAVMFKAERAEDLDHVYQQVALELHSLYSMAYAPKTLRKDGKWKRISVAVSLPGAKARTKRGYYAK